MPDNKNSESDSLEEIMRYITETYKLNQETCPGIPTRIRDHQDFIVKHLLLHILKSVGRISEQIERRDHGGDADEKVLGACTVKILINTLRLASELQIPSQKITEEIPRLMRSQR